ncbi:hypothetical protein Ancab_024430, partial [Ancistrocladus abbreviatus]
ILEVLQSDPCASSLKRGTCWRKAENLPLRHSCSEAIPRAQACGLCHSPSPTPTS